MNKLQLHSIVGLAATVSVLVAEPVRAQLTPVTGVQLSLTKSGLEVILETPIGKSPPVFTTRSDRTFVANVVNTQLALPNGKAFRQDNPVAGIRSVVVTQQTANSIRVTVIGETELPTARVTQSDRGLVLSVTPAPGTMADIPIPFDARNFNNLGNLIFQSQVESERFGGRLQIETPLFNEGAWHSYPRSRTGLWH